MKNKTYIFAHMSVKAWGGGGVLKALADLSTKNVCKLFLDGSLNRLYLSIYLDSLSRCVLYIYLSNYLDSLSRCFLSIHLSI